MKGEGLLSEIDDDGYRIEKDLQQMHKHWTDSNRVLPGLVVMETA